MELSRSKPLELDAETQLSMTCMSLDPLAGPLPPTTATPSRRTSETTMDHGSVPAFLSFISVDQLRPQSPQRSTQTRHGADAAEAAAEHPLALPERRGSVGGGDISVLSTASQMLHSPVLHDMQANLANWNFVRFNGIEMGKSAANMNMNRFSNGGEGATTTTNEVMDLTSPHSACGAGAVVETTIQE